MKIEGQPVVYVKILNEDASIPSYEKDGDAGADLRAIEDVYLHPNKATLVKTGIAIELPPGYEAQVRPRSGMALKQNVTVLNSPGTIDEGYRGEVGVILIYHAEGGSGVDIKKGERIAQLVIKPVEQARFIQADDLSETSRGEGGFGSTGKK